MGKIKVDIEEDERYPVISMDRRDEETGRYRTHYSNGYGEEIEIDAELWERYVNVEEAWRNMQIEIKELMP